MQGGAMATHRAGCPPGTLWGAFRPCGANAKWDSRLGRRQPWDAYPFTTPIGRRRATLRVMPASCMTETTASTSL